MKDRDRVINMLGLAEKAGRMLSGEKALEAIKNGKAKLCVLTTDVSDNTEKLYSDKCSYYNVPFCKYGTRIQTGHPTMVIIDENFARAIKDLLGGKN